MTTENLSGISLIREMSSMEQYEYLLVAYADEQVNEKIMAEQDAFYKEYKGKIYPKTKPYIKVANFFANEAMEDTIIRWTQRIFTKQPRFTVTLNNFSGFPPHTIYLRIQNMEPFQQMAKELKVLNTYIRSCSCPPMKIISDPHISVAGSLPEEIYFKALIQYAHKSFHESFVVNELLLVRRKHRYDTCKTINVFALRLNDEELPN